MRLLLPLFASTALLGGCAMIPQASQPPSYAQGVPGSELVGRDLGMETATGQVSTLRFSPDGVVHALFGTNKVAGNWVATEGKLCFAWAGASRECWPYSGPLPRGETVTLTSDLGNVVRVTLQ